ncbi:hypothetical protein HD554DRAFT_2134650 [Boletus coccyginus]|nr:hypothetical protein HD554DRAFT_2134650 [Boletus coccyginus]
MLLCALVLIAGGIRTVGKGKKTLPARPKVSCSRRSQRRQSHFTGGGLVGHGGFSNRTFSSIALDPLPHSISIVAIPTSSSTSAAQPHLGEECMPSTTMGYHVCCVERDKVSFVDPSSSYI